MRVLLPEFVVGHGPVLVDEAVEMWVLLGTLMLFFSDALHLLEI